jgi:hypothetical protein
MLEANSDASLMPIPDEVIMGMQCGGELFDFPILGKSDVNNIEVEGAADQRPRYGQFFKVDTPGRAAPIVGRERRGDQPHVFNVLPIARQSGRRIAQVL